MTNKTYSGLPKPVGKSGHFYESRRHSLQARGLKTGHLATPISINSNYWSLERDEKDKMKLTLGNFSDAGWFWDGDKSQLAGFMIRLHDSKAREDFLAKMEQNKIKLSDFKEDILKSAEKGDGIYMLTGDNRKWHFGEDNEELSEAEAEVALDKDIPQEKLSDNMEYSDYKGDDYDAFKKSPYYKEVKDNLIEAIKKSESWGDLFTHISEIKLEALTDSSTFSMEKAYDLANAAADKIKRS
jgi:hypothetical protein